MFVGGYIQIVEMGELRDINGLRLNNLRFADNIILIGKTKEKLARMGIELFKECEKRGLVPNKITTKYMNNNPDSQMDIDGTINEEVEDLSLIHI